VIAAPYSLLAEVTHRCPLHCVYCSNPIELQREESELSTADWLRVLEEAGALGVVQVGLSGGEPLLRSDLELLVRRARSLGMYSNLITSGLGLDAERAHHLAQAGLNSIQISIQAAASGLGDRVAGRKAHEQKHAAASVVLRAGLPLNMNVVIHRLNIDTLAETIDLCAGWGAERLEVANTQYYGWALRNRRQLMPTATQLRRAKETLEAKRQELQGRLELIWVPADYHGELPKPCMGGWGRVSLTVAPNGDVMPCPVASSITGMQFESVRDRSLDAIWHQSTAFNAFRGYGWMRDPCRSCPRREIDFGGCRCQAYSLTGDATRTDPVCRYSPDHHLVVQEVAAAAQSKAGEQMAYRHLS
jgi:pyrroloquinoline quinone biosynthesis protein E